MTSLGSSADELVTEEHHAVARFERESATLKANAAELTAIQSQTIEYVKRCADDWHDAYARVNELPASSEYDTFRSVFESGLARAAHELRAALTCWAGVFSAHEREQAALRGDPVALRQIEANLRGADADRAQLYDHLLREGRNNPDAVKMRAAIEQERAAFRDKLAWWSLVGRMHAGRELPLRRVRTTGRRLRARLSRRWRGSRSPPDDPSRPLADPPTHRAGPADHPCRDDEHTGGETR